jgi:hypothetical protein
VTVSGTSVAAAWSGQAASGAVPPVLLANTVDAAGLLAAGETVTAGLVSAGVCQLTEGVLHGMATKQKAGVVLLVAALVLAGGLVTYHALVGPPDQPVPPPPSDKAVVPEHANEDFGTAEDAIKFMQAAVAEERQLRLNWNTGDKTRFLKTVDLAGGQKHAWIGKGVIGL